jgi:hypothetical protein
MRGAFGVVEAGPLHHHGPEVFPLLELVVGGGLTLAAAAWAGRLRAVTARLGGGSGSHAEPPPGTEEDRTRPVPTGSASPGR